MTMATALKARGAHLVLVLLEDKHGKREKKTSAEEGGHKPCWLFDRLIGPSSLDLGRHCFANLTQHSAHVVDLLVGERTIQRQADAGRRNATIRAFQVAAKIVEEGTL